MAFLENIKIGIDKLETDRRELQVKQAKRPKEAEDIQQELWEIEHEINRLKRYADEHK